MDQTFTTIIEGARDLLTDPKRWTKRTIARVNGVPINELTINVQTIKDVDSVCSVGAVYAQLSPETVKSVQQRLWDQTEPLATVHRLLKLAIFELFGFPTSSVISWQDASARTHEEVLAVFNRALEFARQLEDDETWKIPALSTAQTDEVATSVADDFTPSEAPVPVDPQLLLV